MISAKNVSMEPRIGFNGNGNGEESQNAAINQVLQDLTESIVSISYITNNCSSKALVNGCDSACRETLGNLIGQYDTDLDVVNSADNTYSLDASSVNQIKSDCKINVPLEVQVDEDELNTDAREAANVKHLDCNMTTANADEEQINFLLFDNVKIEVEDDVDNHSVVRVSISDVANGYVDELSNSHAFSCAQETSSVSTLGEYDDGNNYVKSEFLNEVNQTDEVDAVLIAKSGATIKDFKIRLEEIALRNKSKETMNELDHVTYEDDELNFKLSDDDNSDSDYQPSESSRTLSTSRPRRQLNFQNSDANESKFCPACNINCVNREAFLIHQTMHEDSTECFVCGSLIHTRKNKLRHIKRYHDASLMYQCPYCNFTCGKHLDMIYHRFEHRKPPVDQNNSDHQPANSAETLPTAGCTNGDKYFCTVCKMKCINEMAFLTHCTMHDDSAQCFVCGTLINNHKDKIRHIRYYHDGSLLYQCSHCNFTCEKHLYMENHKLIHKIEEKHNNVNNLGDQSSNSEENSSMTDRHLEDDNFCVACQLKCINKMAFLIHKTMHKESRKCFVCGYYIVSNKHKLRHIKRAHDSSLTYQCPYCDFTCERYLDMVHHKFLHTGGKPYVCSFCGYRQHDKRRLEEHVRKHTGEKPCLCPTCGKSFISDGNLKSHMAKVHAEAIRFNCDDCRFSCVKKYEMILHVRVHQTKKKYACPWCEYSSNDSANLRKHTRQHTGEKPFVCSMCEFRASDRSTIREHMRIHKQGKGSRGMRAHPENMLKLTT